MTRHNRYTSPFKMEWSLQTYRISTWLACSSEALSTGSSYGAKRGRSGRMTAGLRCHVGRVGTMKRVKWAQGIGVDSIDSCQPLRNETEFERFCRALNETTQEKLFEEVNDGA
jgi:hypothetical protein